MKHIDTRKMITLVTLKTNRVSCVKDLTQRMYKRRENQLESTKTLNELEWKMSFHNHHQSTQARSLFIATILLKGRLGETLPISMTHSLTTLTTPNSQRVKPGETISESHLEPKTHSIP